MKIKQFFRETWEFLNEYWESIPDYMEFLSLVIPSPFTKLPRSNHHLTEEGLMGWKEASFDFDHLTESPLPDKKVLIEVKFSSSGTKMKINNSEKRVLEYQLGWIRGTEIDYDKPKTCPPGSYTVDRIEKFQFHFRYRFI